MRVVLLLLCVYALICLAVFLFHKRLIYVPYAKFVAAPADAGLAFRDVLFRAPGGPEVHGWIVEPRAGEPAGHVLFFHGNGGNISYSMDAIDQYATLGMRVMIFDYRGYGRSGGRPSEKAIYADSEAALDFFCRECGITPEEVVYVGRSLGGAAALELALRRAPAALVLESAFTSIPDMGGVLRFVFPVRLLIPDRFDNLAKIGRLTCPLLVIHSPQDDVVPFDQGRRLFEAARGDKEFLETSGDHNYGFSQSGPLYTDGLRRFLLKHSPAP